MRRAVALCLLAYLLAAAIARASPQSLASPATPPLTLVSQTFEVAVAPVEGKVAATVTWTVENGSEGAVVEFKAFISDVARLSDVTSPHRELSWERLSSLVPFFAAVRIVPSRPIAPGERIAVRFAYEILRAAKASGLAAMSASLGPEEVYLFECWHPTLEPYIDAESYIGKVQKAPFTLTATVPEGYTALTVGILRETRRGAGEAAFSYECGRPAPFLIPLVVAPFALHAFEDRAIPSVELFAAGKVRDEAATRELCGFAARAASHLARRLGQPVPARLRIALLDTGGIARGFPDLLALPPHFAEYAHDFAVKATVCHELSHTYFGNLVTAYGPGGNEFLAEGLATFVGTKTVGALDGREIECALFRSDRDRFLASEVEDAAILNVRPMQNVLSGEVYRRGSLVFNELARWVGEETLWRVLREYLRRNSDGYVNVGEFRALAREVAGRDLGDFFTQYLETTNLPWVELAGSETTAEPSGSFRTALRVRNRGNGFGLVPVLLDAGDGDPARARAESMFVAARSEGSLSVVTPFRVTRCTVDPDGTFLHGVRRASMLAQAKDLRQKGQLAQARAAYRKALETLPEDGEFW